MNPLPNLPPVPDFAEAVVKSKADAARLHEIAAELAAKITTVKEMHLL